MEGIRKTNTDECMLFARSLSTNGYSRVTVKENGKWKTRTLHRELYLVEVGDIPEGHVLDHLCENKPCINTEHLEPVTISENIRRGKPLRLLPTHCPQGHNMVETGYYVGNRGTRVCRLCESIRSKKNYAARKASFQCW